MTVPDQDLTRLHAAIAAGTGFLAGGQAHGDPGVWTSSDGGRTWGDDGHSSAQLPGSWYCFLAMTTSAMIRKRVESADPGTFFRTGDFEGSTSAVETALSRLARAGLLRRVHRGLYWKGVRSRFGSGRPPALAVGVELAGRRGVGPAGWTASHVLGLSTQVPPTTELSIAGRHAPSAPEGIRFHTRANLDRLDLRFHEIALLEVLRDWPTTTESDWARLLTVVHELESKGLVDIERLKRSAGGEPPHARNLVSSLTA